MDSIFAVLPESDLWKTLMKTEWRPAGRLARGNAVGQILDDLRSQILSGRIPRGTKLPSEKQLADAYGVSSATVREALRGLTTSELVEIRHGSGTYVTAHTDQLLDAAMRAVIQIERIGVGDVLQVLGGLNSMAAKLAAEHATDEQLQLLEDAQVSLDSIAPDSDVSAALSHFLDCLAVASGNPLLRTLCGFLSGLQITLARDRSGGALYRDVSGKLSKERHQVVKAILSRDPAAAFAAAATYQERSAKVLLSIPKGSA